MKPYIFHLTEEGRIKYLEFELEGGYDRGGGIKVGLIADEEIMLTVLSRSDIGEDIVQMQDWRVKGVKGLLRKGLVQELGR